MDTRREFLKKAALFSGSAGISGSLLASIQRALAIEPAPGSSFLDAEHVVILMQENRSFDHSYGTLRGVRGYNDPRAIRLPNGNPVWVQTNAAGESYVPFRLNLKDTSSTWMGCLPHSWTDQVDARNDGRYDRWLDCKRSGENNFAGMPLTLGYYTRDDIPFYYELADAFTICDQNFCSSLTGTTPNRLYLWSGTIRPQQSADAPAHVLNSDTDMASTVGWTTFPERLEDYGISWKIYQNELSVGVGLDADENAWLGNFDDNPIEYFNQYHVRFSQARRRFVEERLRRLRGEIKELNRLAAAAGTAPDQAAELMAELKAKTKQQHDDTEEQRQYNDATWKQLSQRDKNLHAKAFCTNSGDPSCHQLAEITYGDGDATRRVRVPKGDVLHQFRRDVENGELPTVSWVVSPERFSDHPCSAWYGAWYIAELLDILTRNPAVWKKTVFILTYDENDGYFDHVPPFVAPHPHRPDTGRVSDGIDAGLEYVEREQELKRKPASEARDSPIGLGYRVPMVIASPWSRGGYVCSQVFDHTSPLLFLERFLTHKSGREIKETNISQWRRAVCGDLTSAFRSESSEEPAALPFPKRNEFIEVIHRAQFKGLPAGYHPLTSAEVEQCRKSSAPLGQMPRQEPGVRRSCALPYELKVEGKRTDDGHRFVIEFAAGEAVFGERAAGSPFVVYGRHGAGDVRTRNYAVSPGDRLIDTWSLDDFSGGNYWLAVYGPNGFFREFRGGIDDPRLEVQLEYCRGSDVLHPLLGNVETHLFNRDDRRSYNIEVADRAYNSGGEQRTLAPGERSRCEVNTERSFGWYDVSVRIEGHPSFEQRYAGHVDTGAPSYSDPQMGGAVP